MWENLCSFPADSPLVTVFIQSLCRCNRRYREQTDGNRRRNLRKIPEKYHRLGPEMPGIDYRIHSADEYILVSGMEESVLIYMEAIKNLLAI